VGRQHAVLSKIGVADPKSAKFFVVPERAVCLDELGDEDLFGPRARQNEPRRLTLHLRPAVQQVGSRAVVVAGQAQEGGKAKLGADLLQAKHVELVDPFLPQPPQEGPSVELPLGVVEQPDGAALFELAPKLRGKGALPRAHPLRVAENVGAARRQAAAPQCGGIGASKQLLGVRAVVPLDEAFDVPGPGQRGQKEHHQAGTASASVAWRDTMQAAARFAVTFVPVFTTSSAGSAACIVSRHATEAEAVPA
jgi:hypothetical protein